MREALVGLAIVALVSAWIPGLPPATAATCGRADYPDAGRYAADHVVQASLWDDLVDAGGFANGFEGRSGVSLFVVGPTRNYTLTVNETLFVELVGGVATNRTIVRLLVRSEASDGRISEWAFTPRSFAGRGGGNLTMVARAEGDALVVFWRWAYLECDEAFPNAYYVFNGVLDGDEISRDNALVYFEAPRPRRGPPVDLILLVVAGLSVSVIFLFARHALKRKP